MLAASVIRTEVQDGRAVPLPYLSHLSYSWQVSTPLRAVFLVDFASALIAHVWFRKYEPRDITSCLARLAVFSIAPGATALRTLPSPWVNVPLHLTFFMCFVLCSILFYRISPFHPLARFPGPIICKTSNIWLAWVSYRGDIHIYFDKLHKKYGPIVRVGPNDLSIIDAKLLPDILGQQGMPRGPIWDGKIYISHKQNQSSHSLIRVRDTNIHAQLRKQWNRAFAPGPLQDYEESLFARGIELIEHLKGVCHDSEDKFGHADIADYIGRWSFDFMGDVAFGESFGLMRNGDTDGVIQSLKASNEIPTITQMIPWASTFFRSIPFMNKQLGAFAKFAITQAHNRMSKVTGKRDLFYHLAASMNIDDDKPPTQVVISNVGIAIVAGSDTSSTVLSGIMYYLLQYPDYLRRLREELDATFPPSEHAPIRLHQRHQETPGGLEVAGEPTCFTDVDLLADLQLLNAIINEVLRLEPPLASGLQRAPAKNSGGKLIGDMFLPEGTAVFVPPYAIHRDSRYFYPKTDEFWPERWYAQSDDVILNRSAYIPFSYGPANCIGKSLALSELRYITAMLVYNFDFWFEDGYNPSRWKRDMKDQVLIVTGKLPVKMKQREF